MDKANKQRFTEEGFGRHKCVNSNSQKKCVLFSEDFYLKDSVLLGKCVYRQGHALHGTHE